jgi:flagellar motor switch protein FliN/FliY
MTDTAPTIVLPDAELAEQATRVAAAVAPLLPSADVLLPGPVQSPQELSAGDWTVAAAADLGRENAMVGVLVKDELAAALAAAPQGGLDLGAALQPALDAAAAALGSNAGAGRTLSGEALATALVAATVAVPLLVGSSVEAVLFLAADSVPAAAPPRAAANGHTPVRGVELLHGVAMEVTVELGRTRLSVRELLALSPGDVLELDRAAGSPADLLVNGRLIARGEVVVVDEDFALRVTEIVAHTSAG